MARLLAENDSDNDSDTMGDDTSSPPAGTETWKWEFDAYINGTDIVPEGMGTVAWWGVRVCSCSFVIVLTFI